MTEVTTSLMGCGVGVSAIHTPCTSPATVWTLLWIWLISLEDEESTDTASVHPHVCACMQACVKTCHMIDPKLGAPFTTRPLPLPLSPDQRIDIVPSYGHGWKTSHVSLTLSAEAPCRNLLGLLQCL